MLYYNLDFSFPITIEKILQILLFDVFRIYFLELTSYTE